MFTIERGVGLYEKKSGQQGLSSARGSTFSSQIPIFVSINIFSPIVLGQYGRSWFNLYDSGGSTGMLRALMGLMTRGMVLAVFATVVGALVFEVVGTATDVAVGDIRSVVTAMGVVRSRRGMKTGGQGVLG